MARRADGSSRPRDGRARVSRRTVLVTGVGVVVVLVVAAFVGPAVYAGFVNGRADPVPTLSPGAAALAPGVPAADGTWTVGAGSFAGYRVHEVLEGHDATVTGRTERVSGTVTVAGGKATRGTVTVQVGDLATDEAPRDAYVRSTTLDTDRFPTATFRLAGAVPASSGTVSLAGRLTVHGVTRDVRSDAQVAAAADRVEVVVSLPATWADYGVSAPRLPFVTVDGHGTIELRLVLER